jgi:hypothetical protein
VRSGEFVGNQIAECRTFGNAFEPPRFGVELAQSKQGVLSAKLRLIDGGAKHADALIVHLDGNWKRMPVLAAMCQ